MLFQRNDTVLFIGDSITDYNRARPVGEGLNNAWGTSYAAMASSRQEAMEQVALLQAQMQDLL